jgi:phosphoglucosamine mutase
VLRFGTDGVRGNADHDLPPEFVVALGRAIAYALEAPRILIGRDTRHSGARIEAELAAGIEREGSEVSRLGVLPTPAIAFHAAAERVPAAIISASHNPWRDKGVMVVGADGRKLLDDDERSIEAALERFAPADNAHGRIHAGLEGESAHARAYVDHLLGTLDGRRLDGRKIVIDCANGATYQVGPSVLREAGADVVVIPAEPDGSNFYEACGSTHPQSLQAAVIEHGAALGLALDGDGDRVLAVDETGALVDGDQIMVMCAIDLHEVGALRNNAIAVTVMTNLGLRRALRERGIGVVETPVGDRHVVAAMQAQDLALGGEQSGHIVFGDVATTGDGLLTGLYVADLVHRMDGRLSALAAEMTHVPQLLVNVRVARTVDVKSSASLQAAIQDATAELGDKGRVLVRASGTEPLVRIMVEADDHATAERITSALRSVVEAEFGSG